MRMMGQNILGGWGQTPINLTYYQILNNTLTTTPVLSPPTGEVALAALPHMCR